MKKLFFMLFAFAGLASAIPLDSCGYYEVNGSKVFDLTRDLPSESMCLTFLGTGNVTLDCHGHNVSAKWISWEFNPGAIWAVGLQGFKVKNCVISPNLVVEGRTHFELRNSRLTWLETFFVENSSFVYNTTLDRGAQAMGSRLSVLDSPLNGFWESEAALGGIDWFYSVKLKFVDKLTRKPIPLVAIKVENSNGVINGASNSLGEFGILHLQVANMTCNDAWCSGAKYFNPMKVTFSKPGYKTVYNPKYQLTRAVDSVVELEKLN